MNQETRTTDEREITKAHGMLALLVTICLLKIFIAVFVLGIIRYEEATSISMSVVADPFGNFTEIARPSATESVAMIVIGAVYTGLVGWIPFMGLKIVKPNEALVLTLFGKYSGTIKKEGFYFVNPFSSAVNPAAGYAGASSAAIEQGAPSVSYGGVTVRGQAATGLINKKVSLKVTTLNNDRQKINDQLGNPINIGIVVVWKVVNPTKAVFDVDNYKEFLSIQCDSALRNIVRLYPYDVYGEDAENNEKTLRGSSQEIAAKLKEEIQMKTVVAGIEIMEARITHLAYAPEIAAAMLQRQQASAIIDARQMIVEGAVGMVEMALNKLNANNIVNLDDERKAAMVSNLLVVLCGNREAQPVVNSGSLY